MVSHQQALADYDYLWRKYHGAADMVEDDAGDVLIRTPTKRAATQCILNRIDMWFAQPDQFASGWSDDPRVAEIAERYGHPIPVEETSDTRIEDEDDAE